MTRVAEQSGGLVGDYQIGITERGQRTVRRGPVGRPSKPAVAYARQIPRSRLLTIFRSRRLPLGDDRIRRAARNPARYARARLDDRIV
jgi:hypothetical protein